MKPLKIPTGWAFKSRPFELPNSGGLIVNNPLAVTAVNYKQHNNPKLSDLETFNKEWYNNRDHLLLKEGIEPFNPDDNQRNWFTQKFKEYNLPEWQQYRYNDILAEYYKRTKDSRLTPFINDIKTKIFNHLDSVTEKIDSSEVPFGSRGTYYPKRHAIFYPNSNSANNSAKIHERTHAATMNGDHMNNYWELMPIRPKDSNYTDELKKQRSLNKDRFGRYDDDIREITARLAQLRYVNKLDPTHTYTLDEVRNMRSHPNFQDFDIFSRYNDEYILYLLNGVAQNTTDKNKLDYVNPITIAKLGGTINLKH